MAKYKKRPDGRYSTSVWDGTFDKDGKKHRKTVYGATIREVDAKVREMAQKIEAGNIVSSSGDRLINVSARWLRERKGYRAESTQLFYKSLIEAHISLVGDVKIEDFRYVHVKRILDSLDGHPVMQKKVLMALKQIVKFAVTEKMYSLPAANDLFECFPKISSKSAEKRPLTEEEKKAVFEADLAPMDRCFLYLLYGCGLRRGEALALSTFSFDFKGHVSISQARAVLPDGRTIVKDPKTGRGTRTLPLPASIRFAVESYARTCAGPLFPEDRSGYEKMWRRIRSAIRAVCPESEGLTPHIFRHNFCTELCYQIPKISLKNVARLLGDSESMVLDVYSHIDLNREPTEEVMTAIF